MPDPKAAALAEEIAWAKVNLTLQVTGRRADGYHELTSLVVFAAVGDRLQFFASDDPGLTIDGPFAAGLSSAEDNLVLKAVEAFSALAGRPLTLAVRLTKNLPVAAGIGGGSADAAAVLRGLCALHRLSPDAQTLQEFALRLGADVPVCLASRPAIMSGIGERLQPLVAFPSGALVLVNPGLPLSTAAVFKARDAVYSKAEAALPPRDFTALLEWLQARPNDLEAAACSLVPAVKEALASLAATAGCGLARMSGSGATCFGLYRTLAEAEQAAAQLRADREKWWVRAAALRTAG